MHADRLRQPAHMYREIRATLRCRYAALHKALVRPELRVCCWHSCGSVQGIGPTCTAGVARTSTARRAATGRAATVGRTRMHRAMMTIYGWTILGGCAR